MNETETLDFLRVVPGADIFYGTSGPLNARIAIVGESWGATERQEHKPFVGRSGQELDKILAECGLPDRTQIFITNVVPEQPANNEITRFFHPTWYARKHNLIDIKGLYPKQNVIDGVKALHAQLERVSPDIIIGFGNYTLWALTDNCFTVADSEGYKVPRGIGWWRGSQLYVNIAGRKIPFLPTFHPAAVFETWPWRYLIKHDLTARVKNNLDNIRKAWVEPKYNFTLRPDASTCVEYINALIRRADERPIWLANDLETRNKTYISCVGIAPNRSSAICIPFTSVEPGRENYFNPEEEYHVVQALRRLYSHPDIRWIGQHYLYDLQYIITYFGVRPRVYLDTMLTHHVCWPGGGQPTSRAAAGITQKALHALSSFYCKHHRYWKDEGKNWEPWMGDEQHWIYNCTDTVKTFEVAEELFALVEHFQLVPQWRFQMDVANDVALEMMLNGVRVDTRRRSEIALELAARMAEYENHLENLIPPDVYPRKPKQVSWLRSPIQQREIFYDILGIKPVLDKKKKTPTTGKLAIPIIARREPIVGNLLQRIQEFRQVGKAYASGTQATLDPDGRLRCEFNPAGTETFRFNSSENAFGRGTNMQNISKGTEDDPEARIKLPNIRKFIVPTPGYEIADYDLSGADAQVVAWEADDEDLKTAFRQGLKLHIKNARDMWPDETRNMDDADLKRTDHPGGMYYKCKRRVHGYNYGSSTKTMAVTLATPMSEEEEFKERWFYLHPGIRDWHRRYERFLRGEQCWNCEQYPLTSASTCSNCSTQLGRTIKNKFGFRVVYFDRVEGLLPQALAWTPQSTVALVCTKGALVLRRNFPWIKLLIHGHDSLVAEYPMQYRREIHAVKSLLHSITIPYDDPLVIPWNAASSTKSWGEVEAIANW